MITIMSMSSPQMKNFVMNGIDLIGCRVSAANSDQDGIWNSPIVRCVSGISSSIIFLIVMLVWIG